MSRTCADELCDESKLAEDSAFYCSARIQKRGLFGRFCRINPSFSTLRLFVLRVDDRDIADFPRTNTNGVFDRIDEYFAIADLPCL